MMNNRFFAVAILSLVSAAEPLVAQQSVAARIRAVERGLVAADAPSGSRSWTLQERMEHYNVPGVSIAVIQDFELAWSKGYGVRDAETGEAVTDTTLFQAASISKSVTAAVALHLVDKDVLQLDSDVNQQLASWRVPENEHTRGEKVTLRRLLSHSAGLTVSGFRGYAPGEAVPTILQILDGTEPANSGPVRVDYVPGSNTRYSGGGYTVVQLLIEDVTGDPFPELAAEIVFANAGMLHSSFSKPLPAALAPLTTSAHTREGEPRPGHSFALGGSGCCGLWTTAQDLARFAASVQRAARGERDGFLSPDAAVAMLTATNSDGVGLGFMLERRRDATYFSHSGGNPPGFTCYLVAHRDAGYGAAVMTNSGNGGELYREIVRAIANAYDWQGY